MLFVSLMHHCESIISATQYILHNDSLKEQHSKTSSESVLCLNASR